MENSVGDPVWFYWPVTVAVVAAIHVRHLVRRRAMWAVAAGVVAAALPVLPLMLNMRVRCDDEGLDVGSLLGSGYVLGASLFLRIAWLAVLNWLRLRAGDDRRAADRTTLWRAGVVALMVPVEAVFSFSSMEAYCTGNGGWPVWHLALAVAVLAAGALAGSARHG